VPDSGSLTGPPVLGDFETESFRAGYDGVFVT